ncbi:hypothetical protein [Stenotrophomonas sp.]|uniref:hypothetical protein n=1 Tax=Stenotrophomonas sp. TaxID=69392 RepID=UPI002899BFB3|nr:hypothetical protein [Stenotrophomonas sp.]
MEKTSTAPGRADASFDLLSKFEPALMSTSRLYANGRQQVAIEVLLVPMLHNEAAELTPAELDSVRLVHYNTGDELSDAWTIAREKNEYSYYPEPGRDAATITRVSRTGEGKRYVIELYVSTTESEGLSRKLALAITRESDGLVVITNGEKLPPNNGIDQSVTLQMVKVPTYSIQNYPFEKNIVREVALDGGPSGPGRVREDGGSPVFIANYHFTAVDNSNNTIMFKSLEVESGGMIQWHDKVAGEHYASYTGYAVPGSDDIVYNPEIELGHLHTPEKKVRDPAEDTGTIVLVGDVNIPFHYNSAINHDGPCRVNAIDEYGNGHALFVRFKDTSPTGRFDLVLYK